MNFSFRPYLVWVALVVGLLLLSYWVWKPQTTTKYTPTVSVTEAEVDKAMAQQLVVVQQLKDSIQLLRHEKIELAEQLALARNANLALHERIRAINAYIRTGRLPSDSTVYRKRSGHSR